MGDASVATSEPFHRSQLPTLTSAIQAEIERRILRGEIAAGARINEGELARAMGVSRGPVREAVRSLAQSGLIELVANRGAVVRRIDREQALELYELRSVIFALACERLARVRAQLVLRRLELLMEESERAIGLGDRDGYYRLNLEFHAAIVGALGATRTRQVYEGLVKEMHLFRRRGLAEVPNLQASHAEHGVILEAIGRGDGAAAFAAGLQHVRNGGQRFEGSLGSEMLGGEGYDRTG